MVKKFATVKNNAGIHCRPSSEIMTVAQKFPGNQVKVTCDRGESDLTSIMSLLALGLQCGEKLTVEVNGPDEEVLSEKLAELFEYEFDFPPQ